MVTTRSSKNSKITNFFEKKESEKKEEKKEEKKINEKNKEKKEEKKEKVKKEVSSKKHKNEEDNKKSPVKENAFKKLKPSNSVTTKKKEDKPLLNPGLSKDFDFESIDPKTEMKIVSYNVGSFNASLKKGFRDYLEAENPDIICIQVSIIIIFFII